MDGTGDALLSAVRRESIERQRLAPAIMPSTGIRTDPIGFHLWVTLPAPWTRSAFVGHTRSTGIGVVASDAFATDGSPPKPSVSALAAARPRRRPQRARIRGTCLGGIADAGVDILVTDRAYRPQLVQCMWSTPIPVQTDAGYTNGRSSRGGWLESSWYLLCRA